jgi:hypothetical protein
MLFVTTNEEAHSLLGTYEQFKNVKFKLVVGQDD